MIEELKKNIETEIEILREISNYIRRLEFSSGSERKIIFSAVQSLQSSLKLINNSIPEIVNNVSLAKKLPVKNKETGLENVNVNRVDSEMAVVLKSKDREKFLRELSISEELIRKIKKNESEEKEKFGEFKAARGYVKLSNKLFLDKSTRAINKGYFGNLYNEIKKSNMDILFEAYVSVIFFTTLLSFILGVIILLFLMIFKIDMSLAIPFSLFVGESALDYLTRFGKLILIPIGLPIVTFIALYFYPSTEKSSISKRIDQELPFAVIHMSAISGSGIEPSEIFRIIAFSKDYPNLRREIRKVLNQINLYGYDLVTALNNVAKNSPSSNLAEVFSGVSTTITTGGSLPDFFEKRADSLLLDYRLEREKYTKIAETFMDIYISVVIAAPMILMLLLIMLSLTGVSTFSTGQLTLLIVFGVAAINLLFIMFLQAKQPIY